MWEQRIIEGEELWLTGPHEFFVQPKHHHLAQPDHFSAVPLCCNH